MDRKTRDDLTGTLTRCGQVRFAENDWQIEIKRRDEDSFSVRLFGNQRHNEMVVDGWYFFSPSKTIRNAIGLAHASLAELSKIRSNPNGWPQTDRHIFYIKGCYTGHPNESNTGCLFSIIPMVLKMFC